MSVRRHVLLPGQRANEEAEQERSAENSRRSEQILVLNSVRDDISVQDTGLVDDLLGVHVRELVRCCDDVICVRRCDANYVDDLIATTFSTVHEHLPRFRNGRYRRVVATVKVAVVLVEQQAVRRVVRWDHHRCCCCCLRLGRPSLGLYEMGDCCETKGPWNYLLLLLINDELSLSTVADFAALLFCECVLGF